MSWMRQVGNMTVTVISAADPETNFRTYRSEIEKHIREDGYVPETGFENLIVSAVLCFDCDDNYGEYDPETGCGGYGDSFSLPEFFRYVEENGGWKEFDYLP